MDVVCVSLASIARVVIPVDTSRARVRSNSRLVSDWAVRGPKERALDRREMVGRRAFSTSIFNRKLLGRVVDLGVLAKCS